MPVPTAGGPGRSGAPTTAVRAATAGREPATRPDRIARGASAPSRPRRPPPEPWTDRTGVGDLRPWSIRPRGRGGRCESDPSPYVRVTILRLRRLVEAPF